MSKWKALAGRITLITNVPVAPQPPSALTLYQQLWTGSPRTVLQPPNPLMPGIAQGATGGMNASCTVFPNRIDFNLGPNTDFPAPAGVTELRLIEDDRAFHAELYRIAMAVGAGNVGTPSTLDRVAIFTQFALLEPSFVAANKALMRVLPSQYQVSLSNEEAFALQVSSPRPVPRFGQIQVNFLKKWSVEKFQVVTFAVPVGGFASGTAQGGMVQPQQTEFIGACLSFDCNTVPSHQKLSFDQQLAVLLEGLRLMEDAQLEYGLNLEGFVNDKTTH